MSAAACPRGSGGGHDSFDISKLISRRWITAYLDASDVRYKGIRIGVYKPDFIIDDKVILEIKVVPVLTRAIQDQVYYYVRGTKYKLVLLANFGTSKVGVKRLIYT